MEFIPEHASFTSNWYGRIIIMTPFWAIGYPNPYKAWVTMSEIRTLRGTVSASINHSGIGTAKNKNIIGNDRAQKTCHPANKSVQPMRTGIIENTSTVNTPWVRARNINASPESKVSQPATGAGDIGIDLTF